MSAEGYSLPSGWVEIPFTEAAYGVSTDGKKVQQKNYLSEGRLPVIDQGAEYIGGYCDDDSLVVSQPLPLVVFGDHTKHLKYVDFPFVCGADGVKLIAPHPFWEPKLFFYFVRSLRFTDRGYSRHFQFLRQTTMRLPPRGEQDRIVAEIEKQFSRLDAGVAALKRVEANLKRYKAAVLKAACDGSLTAAWRAAHPDVEPASELLTRILRERRRRWEEAELAKMRAKGKPPKDDRWKERYEEPVTPKTGELPGLPKTWTWATWEQISPRVTVGHVGPMKHRYVSDGIPFLRSQNVRELRFDRDGLLHIPQAFHEELSKSVLRAGDLVVVRSGSVGVTCVIPDDLGEANCADLVIIKKPLDVQSSYGCYYMNSLARRHIAEGKVGVALTHFNTQSVAALPVGLPPLKEQIEIVEEVERTLSACCVVTHQVETQLRRAGRLRQSILRSAFGGKLVEQDPKDEPASVLLERIRAEREQRAASREARAKAGREARTNRGSKVRGKPPGRSRKAVR